MVITCPRCNQAMTVADEHLGKNINCPHCSHMLRTQAPQAPTPAASGPAPVPMARPLGSPPAGGNVARPVASGPAPTASKPGNEFSSIGVDPDQPSKAVQRARKAKKSGNVTLILTIVAIVLGTPALICCGVGAYLYSSVYSVVSDGLEDIREREKNAVSNAENVLKQHGLTNIRNTKVEDYQTEVYVNGTANEQGFAKTFRCRFSVSREGENRYHWALEELTVEGENYYVRE